MTVIRHLFAALMGEKGEPELSQPDEGKLSHRILQYAMVKRAWVLVLPGVMFVMSRHGLVCDFLQEGG